MSEDHGPTRHRKIMNATNPPAEEKIPQRNSLFSRLRSYFFFVPIVYLYTGVLGTMALVASIFDGTGRVQHWFARNWSQLILKTIGIRVRVIGVEHVHAAESAVYAANHLS